MAAHSYHMLASIRYIGAGFLLMGCGNFVLNQRRRTHPDTVYLSVPDANVLESPEHRAVKRRLQLLAEADEAFKPVAARMLAASEGELFQPDPKIRQCMQQYQVAHPQGYRLWDAVEHCNCQIPTGVSPEKLKGIFVRNQDNVSSSLNEVELRMMGVKTNPDSQLLYHEAKRLRKPGLPPGVDPSKPRNTILEAALAITPSDGAWEEIGMRNYWDSARFKRGQLKYGSLWSRDTWCG